LNSSLRAFHPPSRKPESQRLVEQLIRPHVIAHAEGIEKLWPSDMICQAAGDDRPEAAPNVLRVEIDEIGSPLH
jgi:hypothetical protein